MKNEYSRPTLKVQFDTITKSHTVRGLVNTGHAVLYSSLLPNRPQAYIMQGKVYTFRYLELHLWCCKRFSVTAEVFSASSAKGKLSILLRVQSTSSSSTLTRFHNFLSVTTPQNE